MFTFLPRQYKKTVIREYRRRAILVFLSLCLALAAFSIALVMPTFLDLYFQRSVAAVEKQQVESSGPSNASAAITQQIADIQLEIATLDSTSGKSMITVLDRLLAQPSSGISISRISIARGSAISMQVQGIAVDRTALVAFTQSLEREPSFSKVNLPVSSLAKNKDIGFDLSIEVKP